MVDKVKTAQEAAEALLAEAWAKMGTSDEWNRLGKMGDEVSPSERTLTTHRGVFVMKATPDGIGLQFTAKVKVLFDQSTRAWVSPDGTRETRAAVDTVIYAAHEVASRNASEFLIDPTPAPAKKTT